MKLTYNRTVDYLENTADAVESKIYKSHLPKTADTKKTVVIRGFQMVGGVLKPILDNPKG